MVYRVRFRLTAECAGRSADGRAEMAARTGRSCTDWSGQRRAASRCVRRRLRHGRSGALAASRRARDRATGSQPQRARLQRRHSRHNRHSSIASGAPRERVRTRDATARGGARASSAADAGSSGRASVSRAAAAERVREATVDAEEASHAEAA